MRVVKKSPNRISRKDLVGWGKDGVDSPFKTSMTDLDCPSGKEK